MVFLRASAAVLAAAVILALAQIQGLLDLQKVLEPYLPAKYQSQQVAVVLPQGTIVGKTLYGDYPQPVEAFRGFPYSLPPTGPRRFRPLEPLPSSNTTYQAFEYGPMCPGKTFRGPPRPFAEDCLTVNVFRPAGVNSSANLPVALYVHGGAFNRGFAAMQDLPSMIGWSESPFIGVSFHYRISALGFLPSALTEKEGLLNLGLRDMYFFFEWFRQNIGEFGGNPEDVTVFGLSAGAHAIGHMIMNTDEPFFQRAIMESGGTTARAVHKPTEKLHEDQFEKYVKGANCGDVPEESVFDCLREQPAEVVFKAAFDVFDEYNPSLRWAFQPTIDGKIIKRRPTEAWESGKWNKIPILTGFTTNEASSYVPTTLDTPEEFPDYFKVLHPELTDKDIAELDKLYPDPSKDEASPYVESRPISVGKQYKRAEAAYAHYAYVCPVHATALHAGVGQDAPVFMYHWAANASVQNGANHGDQKPYEAYEIAARTTPFHEKLAGEVHAYWTSFITQKGDPNALKGRAADRPEWLPYKKGKQEKKMIFGEGNDELAGGTGVGTTSQVVDDTWARKECDWWYSKGKKLHQ
ncbi:Cholinesterase [Lasiodiplodia hormozganensis]|uniref:Carboxylic ester hydrolase n=1 Tax=Lasiodiplodia hormozganensis TaxID=869390 RepID=A0AA39Z0E9_9PEZI|nr:Cholinesterase [Lasiodiplodia hormozganensis]